MELTILLQTKVSLIGVSKPPVAAPARPGRYRLDRFHEVIQATMG
jgi:hypothetical protein